MAEKKKRNYISAAISSIIVIAVLEWLWPSVIPIDVFSVWDDHGAGLKDWFVIALPICLWGLGLSMTMNMFMGGKAQNMQRMAIRGSGLKGIHVFGMGTITSLWAGITEEIAFRWLIFLGAIPSIKLGNFLFFGFLGFGFPEWFHFNVWGPLADWSTLRYITEHILYQADWAVGAAVLYTNAFFRDAHRYKGPIGWINSWFGGMYFFWVMFNYGLLAAIVIHILYDFVIFTYVAIRVALTR